jgi:hypothetical protein
MGWGSYGRCNAVLTHGRLQLLCCPTQLLKFVVACRDAGSGGMWVIGLLIGHLSAVTHAYSHSPRQCVLAPHAD